jgi:ANTAR domain
MSPDRAGGVVVRRTRDGWRVEGSDGGGSAAPQGQEDDAVLPDLVSAMVLAELLADDVPRPRKPAFAESTAAPCGGADASRADASRADASRADASQAGAADADRIDAGRGSAAGIGTGGPGEAETTRLKATIVQLEHALAARVRIEQAIGVLSERHRLSPRQAFGLLRKVARSGGRRVHDLAGDVVASATNPLLLLPTELARTPVPQPARRRSHRSRGE